MIAVRYYHNIDNENSEEAFEYLNSQSSSSEDNFFEK